MGIGRIRLASLTVLVCVAALPASAQGASGTWERTWGKGVLGGAGAEICATAASCQAGSNVAPARAGEFNESFGVATDVAGNVYVSDLLNNRVQKFDSFGNFQLAWGDNVIMGGGTDFEICTPADTCQAGADATAAGGELDNPTGVATDAAGNVYVSDGDNHRVQKFSSSGQFLRAWGKDVVMSGPNNSAGGTHEVCVNMVDVCKTGSNASAEGGELSFPGGVAINSAGQVFVADSANNRVQRFDSNGGFQRAWGEDVDSGGAMAFEICTVDTFCKKGITTAPELIGELDYPNGLATDAGHVYVADGANDRIQRYDFGGNPQRTWGKNVVFSGPNDTVGGNLEICVSMLDTCQTADPSTGRGGEFDGPAGLAVDPLAGVYVADAFNNRVQKFNSDGGFARAWGKDVVNGGGIGFEICTTASSCKLGSSATALGGELKLPFGVAADATGTVYVADRQNHRVQKFAEPVPSPAIPAAGATGPLTVTPAAKRCKRKGKKRKKRRRCAKKKRRSSAPDVDQGLR